MKSLMILCVAFVLSIVALGQSYENISEAQGIDATNFSAVFGSGISFYDYNRDGWDDLTIGLKDSPFKFYRNIEGVFFEETLTGLSEHINAETKSVLWVDFDNDGDSDFFSTYKGAPVRLFENNGSNVFTEISNSMGIAEEPVAHWGSSWADFDRDGDLDLYILKNEASGDVEDEPFLHNYLYRNDGNTFTEISEASGVDDSLGISFQSIFWDYDLDGWLDLYICNDKWFENSLYRNSGDGTFEDVGAVTGMNMVVDGMCTAAADYNNDGFFDMYITNTETGGGAIGNLLMKNNGGESFENISAAAGTQVFETCWGSTWLDINNDGWLDLHVAANGNFPNSPLNHLFRNNGNDTFTQVNDDYGMSGDDSFAYANCTGDMNNDGYADLACNNRNPDNADVWRSEGGTNKWLKISLEGVVSNRDGIGSIIRVYANGLTYTRQTYCGENYLSQNSQREIFGLLQAQQVDSISVDWPSGHHDAFYNLLTNQTLHIIEGSSLSASIQADGPLGFCEGGSVTLTVPGYSEIQWSNEMSVDSLIVTEAGEFTAELTTELGFTLQTDPITVEVFEMPASEQSTDSVSCFGLEDGSASIEYIGETGLDSIYWSNGITGNELFDLSPGIYHYTLTDLNGCQHTDSLEIFQPEELTSELEFTDEFEEGELGTAAISIEGGTPPYEVLWSTNESTEFIQNLTSGDYSVTITDGNGCTSNHDFEISFVVGINEMIEDALKVYPNPFGSHLIIENAFSEEIRIRINDVVGKIMWDQSYSESSSRIKIPTESWPTGIYFLNLIHPEFSETHSLIKE